ncbi:DUF5780 domain-containing protein [Paenibacillus jiagnxiensis]|uniref:DUF5780 domain-containing protein n=1 Tax=Paenibacillus jiagnxiensis TaxID=3228926 RepID=UPI003476AA60
MNCKQCNHVLQENSVFCNHCGKKVDHDISNSHWSPRNKKLYIISSVGVLVVLILVGFFLLYKNPLSEFKSAVRGNDYSESNQIYNSEIKGNVETEKDAIAFLMEEVKETKNGYVSQNIEFAEAKTRLETIERTGLVNTEVGTALSEINELQNSRTAFQKGKDLLEQKNYKEALIQLNKVIEQDENYAKAKELSEQSSDEYKKAILAEADKLAAVKKYGDAVKLMDTALSILPDEPEFAADRDTYYKSQQEQLAAERRAKMQAAAEQQEVVVETAKIIIQSDEYKALWPDMIQVIVSNHSSKTVKNMKVSTLGFDSNGYPIKIDRIYGDDTFEFIGTADNVNIVPNSSFGEDNGWEIDENHGIDTVLACVKEVEYYDGSKWENPYYDYWIEEYKEQPLH